MKTPSINQQLADAIAFHSIAKFGNREADRDTLLEGASHDINLNITGTVGKKSSSCDVNMEINGRLVVGHDNPTGSTTNPNATHMLCAAFAAMAKTRREQLVKDFKAGKIPEPDKEMLAIVASVCKQLQTKKMKRGAVSFQEVKS